MELNFSMVSLTALCVIALLLCGVALWERRTRRLRASGLKTNRSSKTTEIEGAGSIGRVS